MSRSHPAVRDLLAKIKRPYRLETDPLGRALRDAKGLSTVREAVVALIDETLRPLDPRLAAIIERCDLQGVKIVAVASEFHVTPRQLFRYRCEAVDALAERIEEILARRVVPFPRGNDSWNWPIQHAISPRA